MCVSFMRQLIHIGRLRRWKAASRSRLYLMTPPVDDGMIDAAPTFEHEFFDMPRAQGMRHVPAYTHENDVLWKMDPLEAHCQRRSPSLFTFIYEGRVYLKSPPIKLATKLHGLVWSDPLHVTRRKKCALFFPRKEAMLLTIRRSATTVAWIFPIRHFR